MNMSNPTLLSAAIQGRGAKYYTPINNIENPIENPIENTSETPKSMLGRSSESFEQFKNRLCINFIDIMRDICASSVCKAISITILILVLILLGFLILFVFIILIGLLCVGFNYIFEKSMVFFIGQTLYNKNFPVCTNTQFIGGSCYTSTSTYCR